MTSLVNIADVRVLVKTSLSDANLQAVIDRVEAEITARIGAPQNDQGTVEAATTLEGEGILLFLPTDIASVVSIVEDGSALAATEYRVWAGGQIERLPEVSYWGRRNVVTYCPADDRALRKQVIIEVVRLDVERTAMKHESVAGEYAYDAPDWDVARRKQFKRLEFQAI
uniref:Uncharacterized protein n=1 Tax=viral metagenome TaxID=1070528 RepID=A0A6H1ZFA3_9ZZZZ